MSIVYQVKTSCFLSTHHSSKSQGEKFSREKAEHDAREDAKKSAKDNKHIFLSSLFIIFLFVIIGSYLKLTSSNTSVQQLEEISVEGNQEIGEDNFIEENQEIEEDNFIEENQQIKERPNIIDQQNTFNEEPNLKEKEPVKQDNLKEKESEKLSISNEDFFS